MRALQICVEDFVEDRSRTPSIMEAPCGTCASIKSVLNVCCFSILPNILTCFRTYAQRQSVLASPLLAWLSHYVELARACGIAVVVPSGITRNFLFNRRTPRTSGASLIDWISDTLSQEYTNLQSLLKCLDHTNIVSDTVCSQAKVVLGCAMH